MTYTILAGAMKWNATTQKYDEVQAVYMPGLSVGRAERLYPEYGLHGYSRIVDEQNRVRIASAKPAPPAA